MASHAFGNEMHAIFLVDLQSMHWIKNLDWMTNCGFLFLIDKQYHVFICNRCSSTERSYVHYPNVDMSGEYISLYEQISKKSIKTSFITDQEDMIRKCWDTCVACAGSRRAYNTFDLSLACIFPFYAPRPDYDLFSAPSLHSSQALVLILRCCLPPDHPVGSLVHNLNARGATADSLSDTFRQARGEHTLVYWVNRPGRSKI